MNEKIEFANGRELLTAPEGAEADGGFVLSTHGPRGAAIELRVAMPDPPLARDDEVMTKALAMLTNHAVRLFAEMSTPPTEDDMDALRQEMIDRLRKVLFPEKSVGEPEL